MDHHAARLLAHRGLARLGNVGRHVGLAEARGVDVAHRVDGVLVRPGDHVVGVRVGGVADDLRRDPFARLGPHLDLLTDLVVQRLRHDVLGLHGQAPLLCRTRKRQGERHGPGRLAVPPQDHALAMHHRRQVHAISGLDPSVAFVAADDEGAPWGVVDALVGHALAVAVLDALALVLQGGVVHVPVGLAGLQAPAQERRGHVR
mmetsp:Transcript_8796/g.28002  ORF Transcript_8796/g.28002 Transcript_8796/m.28002 type:complete len:203 (+) Transcript_8796:467-1075(+)